MRNIKLENNLSFETQRELVIRLKLAALSEQEIAKQIHTQPRLISKLSCGREVELTKTSQYDLVRLYLITCKN